MLLLNQILREREEEGIYENSLQGVYERKNPKKSSDYKPGGVLF